MNGSRLFVAVALACWAACAAQADTVVVTSDRMIDVLAGRVVDHPQITIVDGRVVKSAAN